MCFKICRKAERERQSFVNELIAYKSLIKRDLVGTAFVLRLDGVFEDQTRTFLAFNSVQRSLADALVGPRSDVVHHKVQWVAQIVLGISAIHSCGIIHRDLEPSNIFLDVQNNIRIAGFDSAFIRDPNDGRRTTDPGENSSQSSSSSSSSILRRRGPSKQRTSTSTTSPPGFFVLDDVCGTWPYMAPEIVVNATKRFKIDKRMCTKAVDYWSLGCLVYALEKGEPLFGNFGDITLYGRCKDNEKYHRFEGLDEDVESVIFGLTRIDATKRFGDTNLRKHPYFRDQNGESEFKRWGRHRPPPPKSRPETYIHIEPDSDVSPGKSPVIYRPILNYTETVGDECPREAERLLGRNPSNESNIGRRSLRNKCSPKVPDPTASPTEELTGSEGEWILGEHCWINPRGIWGASAGRGMPDMNIILYETRL
ncbi:kinase-like domain-containing protein [Collybia nuda]|uniref:Kinase-like domain-containing protein n=1 Tax=Collybia nuda TaxID=64659 RepID=A0A9P6CJW2_9AGAR|nr:kinase-like domain-containing protein [Collybia nuda]